MTAGSSTCPATGTDPFDAPSVWDGTCSTMDPVASASSITVSPPTLGSGMCTPSMPNVVAGGDGPTIALMCVGVSGAAPGLCPSPDEICAYPNIPGFRVCTNAFASGNCPNGWSDRFMFYTADCTCNCGAPTGEICSSTVTAYSDSACSNAVGSKTLTSTDQAGCVDLPSTSPLGSKSATVSYTPGTCKATLTPVGSETLCCLPKAGGT
jgi:hypothetical protein